jgi:hypothetical protein
MQITNYINEIIIGAGTALTGWWLGVKRSKKEIDAIEIANIREILTIQSEQIAKQSAQIERLEARLIHTDEMLQRCKKEMQDVIDKKLNS